MSKGVSKRTAAALCAVCAVAAFGASTVLMQLQFEARLPDYAANNAIYTKLGEIRQRVDDYYVGEYDVQDAVDMALDRVLSPAWETAGAAICPRKSTRHT